MSATIVALSPESHVGLADALRFMLEQDLQAVEEAVQTMIHGAPKRLKIIALEALTGRVGELIEQVRLEEDE